MICDLELIMTYVFIDTQVGVVVLFLGLDFEQIDGVSMGGSLGPVLANIRIITEFENEVIKKMTNNGVIKLYCRYVDETLLLIKPESLTSILDKFHKFDPNNLHWRDS